MPAEHPPDRAQEIPGREETVAGEAAGGTNEDGPTQRAVPKAQPREARRNAWISESMWRLIDKRVSARRDPRYGKAFKRRLGKEVQKSLATDRRRRADEAGAEVEALVKADPPLIQEACYRLQGL